MARRELLGASALLAAGLMIAGCAGGSDTAAQTTTQSAAGQTTVAMETTAAMGTSEPGAPSEAPGPQSFGAGVDELRDGVWQVGDAGEVEFALSGGALSLTEVRPAQGWQHQVSDADADEIEVRFTQGDTQWKFEVELDDGALEITKKLQIRQAGGGAYQVGSAGEVSVEGDGSAVSLGEVRPSQGWSVTEQDVDSDEVEIEFRDGSGGKAQFQAESNNGGLEVEISQKREGPIPA